MDIAWTLRKKVMGNALNTVISFSIFWIWRNTLVDIWDILFRFSLRLIILILITSITNLGIYFMGLPAFPLIVLWYYHGLLIILKFAWEKKDISYIFQIASKFIVS